MKTILVISHENNTFDKKQMLNKDGRRFLLKPTNLKLKNFIKKDKKLRNFYMNKVKNF